DGPHPGAARPLRGRRLAPDPGGRRHEHGPRAQLLPRPPRPFRPVRPRGDGGGRQDLHRHRRPRRERPLPGEVRRLPGETCLGAEGEGHQLHAPGGFREVPRSRQV
ncbi:MAG: DNA polymerase X family, partial [uncultured Rubrobacteraceae bacterium]